ALGHHDPDYEPDEEQQRRFVDGCGDVASLDLLLEIHARVEPAVDGANRDDADEQRHHGVHEVEAEIQHGLLYGRDLHRHSSTGNGVFGLARAQPTAQAVRSSTSAY